MMKELTTDSIIRYTDFESEFQTVDMILGSCAETRGVDAFALSLIKAERQARKILSFLAYQSSEFGCLDVDELIDALAKNRNVYFDELIKGIDKLSAISVQELVGADYDGLIKKLQMAKKYRNKIFHGQLTGENITRAQLLELIEDVKKWCRLFSTGALQKFGYDGFARNSFQKSSKKITLQIYLNSIAEYREFLSGLRVE